LIGFIDIDITVILLKPLTRNVTVQHPKCSHPRSADIAGVGTTPHPFAPNPLDTAAQKVPVSIPADALVPEIDSEVSYAFTPSLHCALLTSC